MSYGITPIEVNFSQVERAIGGGDDSLAGAILDKFSYRFERDRRDEDDEDEPTLEGALRAVVAGAVPPAGYGHKYAYALEMLCLHFGEELPNQHFTGMRSSWAEAVDDGLAAAGVPEDALRVGRHLMYRGSPVPIPEPDDFPFIGHLRAAEVGPALAALGAADLGPLDPDVGDAVVELKGWLESCSRSGCDLVCFYY